MTTTRPSTVVPRTAAILGKTTEGLSGDTSQSGTGRCWRDWEDGVGISEGKRRVEAERRLMTSAANQAE